MYSAKKSSGNRRAIATCGGSRKSSSSRCGYTPRVTRERKSRDSYYREHNTSWEYGYENRSGTTVNRAPDPSMSMNHAMEFVNLDNYIANMFG